MHKRTMHFERVPLQAVKNAVKRTVKENARAADDNLPGASACNEPNDKLETQDSWQLSYQHALVELNRNMLVERIAAAESAMFNRLRAIEGDVDGRAERQVIEDAQRALDALKCEP